MLVAKDLVKHGFIVEPGDRVEYVFVGCAGKKTSEKAKAAVLAKDDALDLEFYAEKLQSPFERCLENMFTPLELAEMFNVKRYKRLRPANFRDQVLCKSAKLYEEVAAVAPTRKRALQQTTLDGGVAVAASAAGGKKAKGAEVVAQKTTMSGSLVKKQKHDFV